MKKIFLISFLILTNLIITNHCLYAGWPINRTPKIEGKITDATTGEPIENVVVSCELWKKYVIGGPGGPGSKCISVKLAVTDKEGKYYLPGETSFHILSAFDHIYMKVIHPLYESKLHSVYFRDYKTNKWTWQGEKKNNNIHYEVELLSLEEKYGMELSTNTAIEFDDYLRNNFSSDKNYFVLSKRLRILNGNFLDYVFSKLLTITDKLPDCEDKIRAKERIKSYIKKYTP